MNKSLKLFLPLFLLAFSMMFAEVNLEKYRLFVSKADPETQSFVLSNGMTCCLIEQLNKIKALPAVGSEMMLYPLKGTSEYRPQQSVGEFDARDVNDRQFLIWMPQDSQQYFLTVAACYPVCSRPAGWILGAKYENIIELSDGSQWSAQGNHMFAQGDHIVISHDNDFGLWNLINVDRVLYLAGSNETYYYSLEVEPFLAKD